MERVRRLRRRIDAATAAATGWLRRYQASRPWLAHVVRAYQRYSERRGDQHAAAVTFFGFLSFFPLIALGYAALGYLLGAGGAVRAYLIAAVNSVLPGLTSQLNVDQIAAARTGAGIFGLVGLLVTGLGWADALREALRSI